MDILSSQANLAGYKAVIESFANFEKAIPMMMTAAGTIPAAKVLVVGAGVAGLQAIATAKRMGAIVFATDVRMTSKEQVESLGGKFLTVDGAENLETEGGYAKEASEDFKKKQEDLLNETLTFFPQFLSFYQSTKTFWKLEYTESFNVAGYDFKHAKAKGSTLPSKSDAFEARYPQLLSNDYDNISRLRQIFNRMPSRLYGYIWNLMTPLESDFRVAFNQRDTFKEFYRDHSTKKGSSSKVIACYLQQAFGIEAFPIDTWVKTFIYYPLGMSPKNNGKGEPSKDIQNSLYEKYHRLDKLEKLIWASSMGNKTNKKEFLDILWCQRYGTDKGDKGPCRGANPLSCSNCILRSECLSYQHIKDENTYVSDDKSQLVLNMKQNDLFFGILTDENTPRQVYTLQKNKLVERDTHSGLDLSTSIKITDGLLTIEELVNQL